MMASVSSPPFSNPTYPGGAPMRRETEWDSARAAYVYKVFLVLLHVEQGVLVSVSFGGKFHFEIHRTEGLF